MMAENLMYYLSRVLREKPEYIVLSPCERDSYQRYKFELDGNIVFKVIEPMPFSPSKLRNVLLSQLKTRHLKRVFPGEIIESDVVIVLGGDVFTESYGGLDALEELLALHTLRRVTKKPVLLLGQSIGPFTGWRKHIMLNLLKSFDTITCRDPLTYKYLLMNGLQNVYLTSDLAFLPLPKERSPTDIIAKDRKSVVLIPSLLLHQYMPYASYENYVGFWAELALEIIKMGYRVILMPHAFNHLMDDDRLAVGDVEIELRLRGDRESFNDIKIIRELPLPSYARNVVFSEAKIVVTARMHGAISALVRGAVPLNLSYNAKSHALLSFYIGEENLVIDVRSVRCINELKNKVLRRLSHIHEEYDVLQHNIRKKYNNFRSNAFKNILFAKNIIKSHFPDQ